MRTLLIIDVQYDFLPGGSLSIPNGNKIIPEINSIIDQYSFVIATKDFHPKDHQSFASQHPNLVPGDTIMLNGHEQVLWPDHCIQNTNGSEITHEIKSHMINKIIYRGTHKNIDGYSAFFDKNQKKSTGLIEYLKSKNIREFDIVGLTTNYSIKYSVFDAISNSYKVNVLTNACCGIDIINGDVDRSISEMKNAGAVII